VIPRSQIAELDRSAHLLYSAEINAPCPNSVIEALACGLPVAAFDAGSLPELVQGDAGIVVPYGGDPWKLDYPDFIGLAKAARQIVEDQQRFRNGARSRAEQIFDLENMTSRYMHAMAG
jgi:glycosyltransferase involved in cell wall biosynthesis